MSEGGGVRGEVRRSEEEAQTGQTSLAVDCSNGEDQDSCDSVACWPELPSCSFRLFRFEQCTGGLGRHRDGPGGLFRFRLKESG